MARPRKDQAGPSARDRIIAAFWGLLEQGGFKAVTIASLSKAANVSSNTLYYHFAGVEDVARRALEREIVPELPVAIAEGRPERVAEMLARNPGLAGNVSRARLFATGGSQLLTGILRDSVKRCWLEGMGVDESELTEDERLDLSLAAGMLSVTGDVPLEAGVDSLLRFLDRPLGRGLMQTFEEIRDAHVPGDAGGREAGDLR